MSKTIWKIIYYVIAVTGPLGEKFLSGGYCRKKA